MELEGRKLGQAYLVSRLGELGISVRQAKRIVKMIADEISQALRRGESVEFQFGCLQAKKGRRSKAPLTIEHIPDDECCKLLEGEKLVPAKAGWSLPPDQRSFTNLWSVSWSQRKSPKGLRRGGRGETTGQLADKSHAGGSEANPAKRWPFSFGPNSPKHNLRLGDFANGPARENASHR
jgi:nucleoid DNA-binding protein